MVKGNTNENTYGFSPISMTKIRVWWHQVWVRIRRNTKISHTADVCSMEPGAHTRRHWYTRSLFIIMQTKQAQWPWKWTNKAMAHVSDEMSPGNYNNHSYYRNILKTIACHLQFMHRKSFYYILCDYVTSWTAWSGSTAASARASGSSREGRRMEQNAQGTSTFLYSL